MLVQLQHLPHLPFSMGNTILQRTGKVIGLHAWCPLLVGASVWSHVWTFGASDPPPPVQRGRKRGYTTSSLLLTALPRLWSTTNEGPRACSLGERVRNQTYVCPLQVLGHGTRMKRQGVVMTAPGRWDGSPNPPKNQPASSTPELQRCTGWSAYQLLSVTSQSASVGY